MSSNAQPDKLSLLMAEEVLRTIYGDDLQGCAVSLDQIAGVLHSKQARTRELMELYDKVIEAIHILSTPPEAGKITDPEQLRSLLGERLDAIHMVTAKTIETTTLAKQEAE